MHIWIISWHILCSGSADLFWWPFKNSAASFARWRWGRMWVSKNTSMRKSSLKYCHCSKIVLFIYLPPKCSSLRWQCIKGLNHIKRHHNARPTVVTSVFLLAMPLTVDIEIVSNWRMRQKYSLQKGHTWDAVSWKKERRIKMEALTDGAFFLIKRKVMWE